MGFFEVFKAIIIPALVAAAIYLVGAFIIAPAIRRYRNKYSQYLPLDSISQQTNLFRDRISNGLRRLVVPRRMVVFDASGSRRGSASGDEFVFEDADGDRMVGFDVNRSDRQIRGANVDSENRRIEEV